MVTTFKKYDDYEPVGFHFNYCDIVGEVENIKVVIMIKLAGSMIPNAIHRTLCCIAEAQSKHLSRNGFNHKIRLNDSL